jgi:putative transposase
VKRAYKYRFYPTAEQQIILAQTFGCCRFVYNWGLITRKTAYFQHEQRLSYNDLAARRFVRPLAASAPASGPRLCQLL